MPAEADRSLSAAELARAAASSEHRVRRFVELGILEPERDVFRPPDIQRVRVAEALDRAGTPPEHLGEVIARGGYTFQWVDALFADPSPLSDLTMEQAARDLDVPIGLIERAYTVWSIAAPESGDRLRR